MVRLLADGTIIVIALVATICLLLVPNKHKYMVYCHVLMAGLTAYLLAKLSTLIYQPATARPFELKGIEPGAAFLNNPGFPSDHVLFATAIVGAVWLGAKRPYVALVLLVLTVLMAIARVLALVHTPLDVIGGAVIASIGFIWYGQLAFTKKRSKAQAQKHEKAESGQKRKASV